MFVGVCRQRRLDAGRPRPRGLGRSQPPPPAADQGQRRRSRRRCSSPPRRKTRLGRRRRGSCRRSGQRRPDAGRPRARRLGQQQTLVVERAVLVMADGGAVARRGARHVLRAASARAGVCGQRRVDAGRPPSPTSRSTAAPGGCRPRCRRMRRRRCSSPPRRTTPSQGRRSGLRWHLRAGTPRRRPPTRPTSLSTAALVVVPELSVYPPTAVQFPAEAHDTP